MTYADVPHAAALAVADLFGKPLRGLLLLCAGLAAALLAGLAWTGLAYLVPLIPLHGWLGIGAEAIASAALILAAVILTPAVTMIVGGVFLDLAAERVERTGYPADRPGIGMALPKALAASARIAAVAVPLNVLALPLYFVPVVNVLVYWGLNGFLLGREYFSMAALRFRDWPDVRALRRKHGALVFLAGLALAAVMSVPVVNLCAPLFGIALMVRLHKRA
jgi:CysZ protein